MVIPFAVLGVLLAAAAAPVQVGVVVLFSEGKINWRFGGDGLSGFWVVHPSEMQENN